MFFHVLQAAGTLIINKPGPLSALIIMYVKYGKVTELLGLGSCFLDIKFLGVFALMWCNVSPHGEESRPYRIIWYFTVYGCIEVFDVSWVTVYSQCFSE